MKSKSFLNIKPLTRRDKLTFGKYENHTIKWIIINDPGYIVWISENIPFPTILQSIIDQCEDLSNAQNDFWGEDWSYWEWWKD